MTRNLSLICESIIRTLHSDQSELNSPHFASTSNLALCANYIEHWKYITLVPESIVSFIGVHWGTLFYVTGRVSLPRCWLPIAFSSLFIFANNISLLPYCIVVTSFSRGSRANRDSMYVRHNFRQGTRYQFALREWPNFISVKITISSRAFTPSRHSWKMQVTAVIDSW